MLFMCNKNFAIIQEGKFFYDFYKKILAISICLWFNMYRLIIYFKKGVVENVAND